MTLSFDKGIRSASVRWPLPCVAHLRRSRPFDLTAL
jgi:hypothetical protein